MTPKSNSEIEAWAETLLEPGRRHLNVDPAEGAFLRELVRSVRAQRALEIGTSTGYSGIWIAMGLRETGGKLITVECDPGRHNTAVESFRETGLSAFVDPWFGRALEVLPQIPGPFDFAFLDAVKTEYLAYYEAILPKMRKGGVIAAHNAISHPDEMRDFLERIRTDPAVKTEIVNPGRQGFSVSWVV